MGVYICIGQQIHETDAKDAISFSSLQTFSAIHEKLNETGKILVFLSDGYHRIKRKAEQIACEKAIHMIDGTK